MHSDAKAVIQFKSSDEDPAAAKLVATKSLCDATMMVSTLLAPVTLSLSP